MAFSSITFVLVFLPLVLLAYLILYGVFHRSRHNLIWCNAFLLGASVLFYAWGEPRYVLLLLASTLLNYGAGLALTRGGIGTPAHRKLVLVVGIALNLSLLGYFKYMNFFVANGGLTLLGKIFPPLSGQTFAQVALPIGISFYTFRGLSYLIDVYRREVLPCRNFVTFVCYLTLFPVLVAGPIVRYAFIADELHDRALSLYAFSQGAGRFILGLAKKMLIADTLGRVADAAFSIPVQELSPLAAWAGAVCYMLQIYYDFSGYSDMAIGLGQLFGFTFPENFNYPYISKNIREFWRRWHMTLSAWFRDYVYIPLGGSRHGTARILFNLLTVFALCGLWHGAAWGFLAWGLYYGAFLVLERVFPRFPGLLPSWLQHAYMLLVVLFGWVIFRADTLTHAGQYIKAMFGAYDMGLQTNRVWMQLFADDVYIALLFGALFAMPLLPACRDAWHLMQTRIPHTWGVAGESARLAGLLLLIAFCMMPLFGATYNAFIYLRF